MTLFQKLKLKITKIFLGIMYPGVFHVKLNAPNEDILVERMNQIIDRETSRIRPLVFTLGEEVEDGDYLRVEGTRVFKSDKPTGWVMGENCLPVDNSVDTVE